MTTWPRLGVSLPPSADNYAEEVRLNVELGFAQPGSWARRIRVDDPPAGVLEMYGEPSVLAVPDEDEHLAVGWELDHPDGWRAEVRARLVRFRPDGTAAYLEARLPGPGWVRTWEISIRGLELERHAARARIVLATVPLIRAWLNVGRPSARDERVASYRSAIEALDRAGYPASAITARLVLTRLSRTGDDAQLRNDVGGWVDFRSLVLRGD